MRLPDLRRSIVTQLLVACIISSAFDAAEAWQWTPVYPSGITPLPRYAASLALYAPSGATSRPVLCGGQGPYESLDDCFIIIPSSDISGWQYTTVVPHGRIEPRAKHVSVYSSGYCFLYGGNTTAASPASPEGLEVGPWDPAPLVIDGTVPVARYDHSAVLAPDGHSWVVFGGSTIEDHVDLGDVVILDLSNAATKQLVWSAPITRGALPSPRRLHSATVWNNYMIVFGGVSGQSVLSDVHLLNLGGAAQWLWQTQDTVSSWPLYGHTAFTMGSLLVVVGGLTQGGAETPAGPTGGVLVLDTTDWNWRLQQISGVAPTTWYLPAVTATSADQIVYFGGSAGEDAGAVSDALFILTGIGDNSAPTNNTLIIAIAASAAAVFALSIVAFLGWWKRKDLCRSRRSEPSDAYKPFEHSAPGVPVGSYAYAYGGFQAGNTTAVALGADSKYGGAVDAVDDETDDEAEAKLRFR